jgi:DNA-directed RNA polymerase subunit M/transcription elongation factor TFIIS
MMFCPNCSAILADPNAPVCPKCGFDRVEAHLDEIKKDKGSSGETQDFSNVEIGEDMPVSSSDEITLSSKCPICSSDLKFLPDNKISFDLMGKDVNIQQIRIMGMNLRKRAITQCIVTFDGMICENNHKFFSKYSQGYKELCPICRDGMKKFGSQVRTCTHCNINISGTDYVKVDGRELLEDEGWRFKPELA